MGILDKFRHHGQGKAKNMSDTAEQKVNEKTGGTYESQVDDAQQKTEGALGMDRERPDRPEQP